MTEPGPAPTGDDLDSDSGAHKEPTPKQRIAPKLGLKGQIAFVTNLRLRARMMDGGDADAAWLRLEPIDLERLDDLAAGLDGILLAEEARKRNNGWGNNR